MTDTAGRSAAAWAAQARQERPNTRLGRVAHVLRLNRRYRATQEALARAREAGAAGERATDQLLLPLRAEGWTILADRAIGGSRANVDHVLTSPCGTRAIVVDSKLWTAKRGPVMLLASGALVHGDPSRNGNARSRDKDVASLRFEARRVAELLRVRVGAVMCVHNAQVAGRAVVVGDVLVIEAPLLLNYLRSMAPGLPNPAAARELAKDAERQLPPYVPAVSR